MSRFDRALDLAERFVRAAERIAEALDRDPKPAKAAAPKRERTLTTAQVHARVDEKLRRVGLARKE